MNELKHYAILEYSKETYQVTFEGQLVAESNATIQLIESAHGKTYPPAIYFPPKLIESLEVKKNELTTHCPIKGDASYWSYKSATNGIWSYENPLEMVKAIKNYFGFDQSKGFKIALKNN
ncbi:MAG: DUF427 domain-containing protein [SAR324 cluster bacterium]|nr:DUF427 domain-containing protein [SAR324 cluster bacterium]